MEKEEASEKGCVEVEDWCSFVHFALGFQRNFIQNYTYVLAKILHSGAKVIQKLTPGFKNQMRNLDNFKQAVETAN